MPRDLAAAAAVRWPRRQAATARQRRWWATVRTRAPADAVEGVRHAACAPQGLTARPRKQERGGGFVAHRAALPASTQWLAPGLEVRDRTNRRAVVRGAAADGGWVVRFLDASADSSVRGEDLAAVPPGKDDRARVVVGPMQGESVVIIGIDGPDAIVRGGDATADTSNVKMYKLSALCKLGRA